MKVILITIFSLVQVIGILSSLIILEVFFWMFTEDKDWIPIIEFLSLTDFMVEIRQVYPFTFLLVIFSSLVITGYGLFLGFKFFKNLNRSNDDQI